MSIQTPHSKPERGNDPEGHVTASIGVVNMLHQRQQRSRQPVIVGFEPFGRCDDSIGQPDFTGDGNEHRLFDAEVTKMHTFPDDDRSTVWFADEDDRSYLLTPGEHYHRRFTTVRERYTDLGEEYGIASLSEHAYVLGRLVGENEGYEPVGVNVALYLPEDDV